MEGIEGGGGGSPPLHTAMSSSPPRGYLLVMAELSVITLRLQWASLAALAFRGNRELKCITSIYTTDTVTWPLYANSKDIRTPTLTIKC